MGATDKGIPFVEPTDLIAGWPAADELQAEKIDSLLGERDQAIGDLESTLTGGSAGQVLTKQSSNDLDYVWLAPQGGGGGGTTPGELISGDDPNLLELSSGDGKLRVGDKDAAGNEYVQGLGGTRHYVGSGRPDAAGLDIQAPEGSTYTCTDSDGGNNFGAAKWSKGPSGWYVTDGDTGWFGPGANITVPFGTVWSSSLGVRRTQAGIHYQFVVVIPAAVGKTWETGVALCGTGWVPATTPLVTTRSGNPAELGYNPAASNLHSSMFCMEYGSVAIGPINVSQYGMIPDAAHEQWPTSDPTWAAAAPGPDVLTLEELQELVEEIQAEGDTHELWPQYEALKQELEQLHNQTGTGDIQ